MLQILLEASQVHESQELTQNGSNSSTCLLLCSFFQVMVVVKYIFQFGFFPWNSAYEMALNEDKPFFLPRILGLEKTDNYIRYDLLQLLALFFHRSLLMVSQCSRRGWSSSHTASFLFFFFFSSVMACGTMRDP